MRTESYSTVSPALSAAYLGGLDLISAASLLLIWRRGMVPCIPARGQESETGTR